jgi:hypothetical protein
MDAKMKRWVLIALVVLGAGVLLLVVMRPGDTEVEPIAADEPVAVRRIEDSLGGALAVIDAEVRVTRESVERFLDVVPESARGRHFEQADDLLRNVMDRALLIREAQRRGIQDTEEYRLALAEEPEGPGREERALVNTLARMEIARLPEWSDAQMRAAYEASRENIPSMFTWETSRHIIEGMLTFQREMGHMGELVEGLRAESSAEINQVATDYIRAGLKNPDE